MPSPVERKALPGMNTQKDVVVDENKGTGLQDMEKVAYIHSLRVA
jgi:hypothetical protein